MSDRVEITVNDHVAEVMLNRPDKFNALDVEMFHALDQAAQTLAVESSVRAVVLHGPVRTSALASISVFCRAASK